MTRIVYPQVIPPLAMTMISFRVSLSTIACFLLSTSLSYQCFAAKPKSIKYVEEVFQGDKSYVHYIVTCSDDATFDISAWDDKKLWCEGKGLKENCNKKKIKTAKKLCKSS